MNKKEKYIVGTEGGEWWSLCNGWNDMLREVKYLIETDGLQDDEIRVYKIEQEYEVKKDINILPVEEGNDW